MSEQSPIQPEIKGSRHVSTSHTPKEHRGADRVREPQAPTPLTSTQIEQNLLESFGIPHTHQDLAQSSSQEFKQNDTPTLPKPPIFGESKTVEPEGEIWKTLSKDTWFYDSPIWDRKRIRLGRVDKPMSVKVVQEMIGSDGRLAQEVIYSYKRSDGKELISRVWVHPKKGGYDGMPKNPVKQKKLDLK